MSKLGKNAKIICQISQNEKVKALMEVRAQAIQDLKQRCEFLDKAREKLFEDSKSYSLEFFTRLEITLKAECLLPDTYKSVPECGLSVDDELGIVFTKDSTGACGHPICELLHSH